MSRFVEATTPLEGARTENEVRLALADAVTHLLEALRPGEQPVWDTFELTTDVADHDHLPDGEVVIFDEPKRQIQTSALVVSKEDLR